MGAIKISCPVCGGKLGLNTDTLAYSCFSNGCSPSEIKRRFPLVYGQSIGDFCVSFSQQISNSAKLNIPEPYEAFSLDIRPQAIDVGHALPHEMDYDLPAILIDEELEEVEGVIWHYYGEVLERYLVPNGSNDAIAKSWLRRVYYDEDGVRKKILHPFVETDQELELAYAIHPEMVYGKYRYGGGNFGLICEGELVVDWVLENWKVPAFSIPQAYSQSAKGILTALKALKDIGIRYLGIIPDGDAVGWEKANAIYRYSVIAGITARIASPSSVERFPTEADLDLGNQVWYSVQEFLGRNL